MTNINYMQTKKLTAGETWAISLPKLKNARILISAGDAAGLRLSYDEACLQINSFDVYNVLKYQILQLDPPNDLAGNILYINEVTGGATPTVSVWFMGLGDY